MTASEHENVLGKGVALSTGLWLIHFKIILIVKFQNFISYQLKILYSG